MNNKEYFEYDLTRNIQEEADDSSYPNTNINVDVGDSNLEEVKEEQVITPRSNTDF